MSDEEAKPGTVKVRNFIDGDQIKKDVSYSLTDLSNAMQEQPQLHLHYATLAAQAARQVDDLELVLEVAESRVYRELRDKYTEEKVKITEAMLEKEVAVHSKVIQIKRAINEAKQVSAISKGAVKSFEQRKDMLVQHGAKDRVEMQGSLRVQEAVAQERDQDARQDRILAKQRAMRGEG